MNAEDVLTLKVRLLTQGVTLPKGEWTGRRRCRTSGRSVFHFAEQSGMWSSCANRQNGPEI